LFRGVTVSYYCSKLLGFFVNKLKHRKYVRAHLHGAKQQFSLEQLHARKDAKKLAFASMLHPRLAANRRYPLPANVVQEICQYL